jgi:hypothetical protein
MKNGLTAKAMGKKMIDMFNWMFGMQHEPRPSYTFNKVESITYTNTGIMV